MTKKPLIIIHGPMGVGKTSVCRYALERLDHAAWLDGDWCWTMHPWSFSERNRAMVLSNITHVLTGFLENPEFDIVLFSWVIHLPKIFDALLDTTHSSRDEVAELVLDRIAERRGRGS